MTTAANGQAAAPQQQNGSAQLMPMERTIADSVLNKISEFEKTGTLSIPKDYSAPNALRAAWLLLQDIKDRNNNPVLQVCTRESVANALLKMVIQGLNPVKRQCSFIAYGNQLTLQREYAGTIAIAKRDAGVQKVSANVVYAGDEFAYEINPETLEKKVTKHIQTLDSLGSNEIKGAYAVIEYKDGQRKTEIMSMAQVRNAWNQGPTKGQSPAHKNFPDQMAMKTVINRALKIDVNSSDDGALMDDGEPSGDDVRTAGVKQEIDDNANRRELSFNTQVVETVDTDTGELKNEATPAAPAPQEPAAAAPAPQQQTTITGPGF